MEWVYNDGGRSLAGYVGEAGDCVTRAISIATDMPYIKVYSDLHYLMKGAKLIKHRTQSPRNGVRKTIYRYYLQSLGWSWVPTMGIGTGCKVHLLAEELPQNKRLIVALSKHLTTVIDSVIYDTFDPQWYTFYPDGRKSARCVYGYFIKG